MEVAAGELAAVVTFLEMRERPMAEYIAAGDCPPQLDFVERPEVDDYRGLFRLVGSRWLWFSRLAMPVDALANIIQDERVQLYRVVVGALGDIGMLELDFRQPGECELAFVGLVPEFTGQGQGRWLLAEALRRAWCKGIERVHVHTCTLDHPAALPAYMRAGFVPYKRAVERFPDPRLLGILPSDCAPQVPLLGTVTSSAAVPES